ncbi:erythromycin esterase family protein [Streptomyces rubrogriseus]|uniref:Erythromycin esterase family protein n=1 Tax=Streptomyces rubrogriseus TaxID=194673 RepID=A0A6G3T718_9ACTN|nr:erythromycin esterase family protein [Streptomyces rubrogriseus]NEC32500.1 erythromycin esterase family protein [Streptomyces rubrogriseus]
MNRRRLLALTAAALTAGTLLPVGTASASTASAGAAAGKPDPVVDALQRRAVPLGDLDGVVRMLGDARVVALGEASHSGHEFFALKARLFKRLAATRGFTTFVLEASWSTGLRLDTYVTRGLGDPEQIMREEFQGQYVFWNTDEYLDLIRWMRHYNVSHPGRPSLRFVGNDLGYPGPEAFDQVTSYVTAHRPGVAGRIAALYGGLRPARNASAGTWMGQQLGKDPASRRAEADRAERALTVLRASGRPRGSAGRAYDWAVQNATAVAQSFTGYAFPDEQFPERMRYRDQVMADNTAWWLAHTNGRILLASNNGHVAYTSDNPQEFPEPVGAFLRRKLGGKYVSVGLTFNEGSLNALPDFTAQQPQKYAVDPAPAGHNEHTLDQVRHRDFALDLRTAPPAARAWLDTARPTRSYGLYWSDQDPETALGRSYDIVIHLHRVEAARLRAFTSVEDGQSHR